MGHSYVHFAFVFTLNNPQIDTTARNVISRMPSINRGSVISQTLCRTIRPSDIYVHNFARCQIAEEISPQLCLLVTCYRFLRSNQMLAPVDLQPANNASSETPLQY